MYANLIHPAGITLLTCCAGISTLEAAKPQPENNRTGRPTNFIIIQMDDMGYGDLTVTGAIGYRTPNIDRLCAEGMRFTNYYSASPVSSASRAGLMTGCYPTRINFPTVLGTSSKVGLHPDEETIPEILKPQGYVSCIVGKWHLGHYPEFLPLNHGFDEYFGLPYSNDMSPYNPNSKKKLPPLPLFEGNEIVDPNVTPEDQDMLTTMYTERSIRFIEENRNRPFFLYLAHSMPHVPLHVSDKFRGKSEQGLYGDVMMEIDWSVGEILKTLEKYGLEENTLIIFTSDNGPWLNYGNHAGSAGGLREGKGTTFEGGQRVACIMRWPGKIPSGTVNNHLASSIDLLPTLADICGATLPAHKIDGVSLRPMLEGDFDATPRKYFLFYYRKNDLEAARNERFKLVLPHMYRTYEHSVPANDGVHGTMGPRVAAPYALYDLRRDPGERYDVQTIYPDAVKELMEIVEKAREDIGDDLTGHPGSGRRPVGTLSDSE